MAAGKEKDPRALAGEMAAALADALGPDLRSVLLYGSVARGEAVRGISDINVLVLVEDVDAALLGRTAPLARSWAEQGVTPLLLERAAWRRGADVFAMELLDMRDAHAVLHGEDPLAGLTVDPAQLRLQAEREVRSRQVQLHNGLLAAADDPRKVGAVLAGSLPAFVTYLRAALRLAGRDVPAGSAAVIDAGCALVGAPADAFRFVHGERQAARVPSVPLTDARVDGFNEAAEATARYVDQAPVPSGETHTEEGSGT